MRPAFYDDALYRKQQAVIVRKAWQRNVYNFKIKWDKRICKNFECGKSFRVKPHDKQIYCSSHCAVLINNRGRIVSFETRLKHSVALKGRPSLYKGIHKVSYIKLICHNPSCRKEFELAPHLAKRKKYCSVKCAMQVIGRLTTSPKASKGKPGIRPDIDSKICFYSTWEANVARVFNLVGIVWQYSPKIFDLAVHTYRPDFYLPHEDMYIEVKNFMNTYSLERDRLFRQKFPYIKLNILSKKEYQEIKANYKPLIDNWED